MIPKEMIEAAALRYAELNVMSDPIARMEAALTAALSVQWRGVESAIQSAEQTLDLRDRVHSELDEGKRWEDIDNGSNQKWGYKAWQAYMDQRMMLLLKDVTLTYRKLAPDPLHNPPLSAP